MTLFELPLWLAAIAIVVMAFATAGMYATMRSIPAALKGVYRMHIYAPPTAAFIFFAAFICMIAPFAGIVPADTGRIVLSVVLAAVFAVVGFISMRRGGYAALS
ncbi:MAG: hypothetical protein IT343_15610 [Candidatus Melainabacteria bacterium]|jgi:hypothetical protein|nr:hypothetical protein [Candidatus Melainabacteria bacterium]